MTQATEHHEAVPAAANQAEWTVQVLVEMEDGSPVTHSVREYVTAALQKVFYNPRDIKAVITVSDEDEVVVAVKYVNNPTHQLKERAWHD